MDFGYPVWLIELLSNIFYNERTWWGLVQKRVVNTELYFYVFIWLLLSLQLCWCAVIPQGYHPPSSQCNGIDNTSLLLSLSRYVWWRTIIPRSVTHAHFSEPHHSHSLLNK